MVPCRVGRNGKKGLDCRGWSIFFFHFFLARLARVEKDYPGMGDGRREEDRGAGGADGIKEECKG